MAFFQLGLRRAAAQLPRAALACGPCLRQQFSAPRAQSRLLPLLRASRRSYATGKAESPLASLSSNITRSTQPPQQGASDKAESKSSFPETSDKVVGYWLVGSAVSVFGIVVFGGLTRLTESG